MISMRPLTAQQRKELLQLRKPVVWARNCHSGELQRSPFDEREPRCKDRPDHRWQQRYWPGDCRNVGREGARVGTVGRDGDKTGYHSGTHRRRHLGRESMRNRGCSLRYPSRLGRRCHWPDRDTCSPRILLPTASPSIASIQCAKASGRPGDDGDIKFFRQGFQSARDFRPRWRGEWKEVAHQDLGTGKKY